MTISVHEVEDFLLNNAKRWGVTINGLNNQRCVTDILFKTFATEAEAQDFARKLIALWHGEDLDNGQETD